MARYKVILAYDGSGFSGSQRLANNRTVQSELESSLRKLGWNGRSVFLAGRTDSGVHATGQVAAFDLEWRHTKGNLLRALNANLPSDLAVQDVDVVPQTFHPRFDAVSRSYCYRIFCQPVRHPLRERYMWRVWPEMDEQALHAVAMLFTGRHDFAAYGSPPRADSSTVRTVMHSSWTCREDEWLFEVQADAFLYRMVRRLVFVQVAVGQGKILLEAVAGSLAGQTKDLSRSKLPPGIAPAHGLTLDRVLFPPK